MEPIRPQVKSQRVEPGGKWAEPIGHWAGHSKTPPPNTNNNNSNKSRFKSNSITTEFCLFIMIVFPKHHRVCVSPQVHLQGAVSGRGRIGRGGRRAAAHQVWVTSSQHPGSILWIVLRGGHAELLSPHPHRLVLDQQRPLPDRRSYMLSVRHALTRKLTRSKTMQW